MMLTEEHREKIKYLNQYRYLDKEIDRKIKELETWRNKIFNVTGTLSAMPNTPSRSDKIATGIAISTEIENEINEKIDELVDLKKEIEGKIDAVENPKLREILKCRYLDFKSWEEIAYRNNTVLRHIFRLHEQALDEIKI